MQCHEKLLGSIDGSGGFELNVVVSYTPNKTVSRLNYESALLFDFEYFYNGISNIEFSAKWSNYVICMLMVCKAIWHRLVDAPNFNPNSSTFNYIALV